MTQGPSVVTGQDDGGQGAAADPAAAEAYRVLRSRIDLSVLPPLTRAVTEAVVCATADFDYVTDLICDEAVLSAGVSALRYGAPVVADSAMVAAGISGCEVICKAAEPLAARLARKRRHHSRSALDFLDAPQRLSRFLDGRLIRLLTAPTKAGGRAYLKVVNAGFGMLTGVVTKILGAQMLRDVQTFVAALDTMFGGFRERAEDTYRLLQTPGTAFLVVATPEPDALREASYFVERLSQDRMPLAGLVLNRVHHSPATRLSAARSLAAAEVLQPGITPNGNGNGNGHPGATAGEEADASPQRYPLAATALLLHAERMQVMASERRLAQRFTAAHPGVPVVEVPAQPEDVHDLAGLEAIGNELGRA